MEIITYFTRQTSSIFVAHNLILTKSKVQILWIYFNILPNVHKFIQNYYHNFCFFWCETTYFKGGGEIQLEICPKIIYVIKGETREGGRVLTKRAIKYPTINHSKTKTNNAMINKTNRKRTYPCSNNWQWYRQFLTPRVTATLTQAESQ